MHIYCTYLTIYSGNKLPPFYIGHTSTDKITNGYHGSVTSKQYKPIWLRELKENPHLFKTIVISIHESRSEACIKEQNLQWRLDVIHNPLYINKAIGKYIDNKGRKSPQTSIRNKLFPTMKGKKHSEATKQKIRLSIIGKKKSIVSRKKLSETRKRMFSEGTIIHWTQSGKRLSTC